MTKSIATWRLSREVLGAPPEYVKFTTDGDFPAVKALEAFKFIIEEYIPKH